MINGAESINRSTELARAAGLLVEDANNPGLMGLISWNGSVLYPCPDFVTDPAFMADAWRVAITLLEYRMAWSGYNEFIAWFESNAFSPRDQPDPAKALPVIMNRVYELWKRWGQRQSG